MIAALLLHGALVVSFLLVFGRWYDEELVADTCLYGLGVELIAAVALTRYLDSTDAAFYAQCGEIGSGEPLLALALVLCFDELTGVFLAILTLALLICFLFLAEYFEYDSGASTITLLSALFSQTALLYFCAFDLLLLIFCWELISLISFFLVQHWAFRVTSYKAGLKVFTISQFGDLPLFCFFFLMLGQFGTTDLAEILSGLPLALFDVLQVGPFLVGFCEVAAALLSAAVFLKAAQFVFYPWLLDAMEAPVPISAQLHSSTLVVIGFYLFFRFQPLFVLAPGVATLFLVAGLTSAVGASVLGFFQDDGKRLLACSTASQLGYVVVGLGLGLFEESLVMLTFCCVNKAFTFVWLGALMRRRAGISDLHSLAGAADLAWAEHAGMLISIFNFTVCPGAFSWHVKSLFVQGQVGAGGALPLLGLEVLQLTWFFSSLYLIALYVGVWCRPARNHRRPASAGVEPASHLLTRALLARRVYAGWAFLASHARLAPGSASQLFLLAMLVAQLALTWWGGAAFLTYSDLAWAQAGWATGLSYY